MRCTLFALAAAIPALLMTLGCQHHAPVPVDLEAYLAEMTHRPLAVESVRSFADALDDQQAGKPLVFDLSDGLSLAEAEAVALAFNSDIRLARLAAEHAAMIADAAGRWDDLELGLDGGRKRAEGGTRTQSLTVEPSADAPLGSSYTFRREAERVVERAWVRSASLSITLPTSGRLQAERLARTASYDAAVHGVAATEWEVLQSLREKWAVWSFMAARLQVLDAHLEDLSLFAGMAENLRDAGELLSVDARMVAIERGNLFAEREELARSVSAERMGLMHLMGLLPDAPVEPVPLTGAPRTPQFAEDVAGDGAGHIAGYTAERLARSHPLLVHLRAEYEVAERALRVELRRQYPDITLSPVYTDERDETALTLGLGMPIPVWNANRAGIAEAVAARDMARARVEAAFEQVLLEVARLQERWEGARAKRAYLAAEVAPMVDIQLEEAQALLRLGEIDMMIVQQALAHALETKLALIDAHAAEAVAALHLDAVAEVCRGEIPFQPVGDDT